MDTTHQKRFRTNLAPRRVPSGWLLAPRFAFTLVELLVVITIIGILASLITVAAVGALKNAQRTRIKAEINQMAGGFDEYKNKTTSYPPNCQTDDTTMGGTEPANAPLDEATVFNDLKRHMKQAFPRHQETDELLKVLMGLGPQGANYPKPLDGGMTAGEALVFWLGGFSSDPKYPISGEGGPAYPIQSSGVATNRTLDPIETRKWIYPFDVARLGARASDGYFDQSTFRYIEYRDPKNQWRRINFWQYVPAKSDQPYLYFDTSRHPPGPPIATTSNNLLGRYDPPAATQPTKLGPASVGLHVYAFKKVSDSASSGTPIQFINPEKFQVIHCGISNAWDLTNFARMSPELVNPKNSVNASDYLLYSDGPFIGDIAEAIVNFNTETKIEDSQK